MTAQSFPYEVMPKLSNAEMSLPTNSSMLLKNGNQICKVRPRKKEHYIIMGGIGNTTFPGKYHPGIPPWYFPDNTASILTMVLTK